MYLTPVTYVCGMSSRKMKPGSERQPTARKALGLRPRRLAIWNYPLGVKRLLKDFKQEIFFFFAWFTLCVQLAKQSTEMSNIPLSTVCPTQMTIVSGLNESPRWWLSTQAPEFPAPEGRFISAPFSKGPGFTLAVWWRIIAMSAGSTGTQAGKEGSRDGGKIQIEKDLKSSVFLVPWFLTSNM